MPYFSCYTQNKQNFKVAFNKVADSAFETNTKNDQMFLTEIKHIKLIKKTEKKKCYL